MTQYMPKNKEFFRHNLKHTVSDKCQQVELLFHEINIKKFLECPYFNDAYYLFFFSEISYFGAQYNG